MQVVAGSSRLRVTIFNRSHRELIYRNVNGFSIFNAVKFLKRIHLVNEVFNILPFKLCLVVIRRPSHMYYQTTMNLLYLFFSRDMKLQLYQHHGARNEHLIQLPSYPVLVFMLFFST